MAGFELTLYGRIWVTPKVVAAGRDNSAHYTNSAKSAKSTRVEQDPLMRFQALRMEFGLQCQI
jgi:hypothetical protein